MYSTRSVFVLSLTRARPTTVFSVPSASSTASLNSRLAFPRALAQLPVTEISDPSSTESDQLKGLISSLLQKVTNIESKLQDLTSIKTQMASLELSVHQFASSVGDLSAKTNALSSSVHQLKDQQATLDKRISALESAPSFPPESSYIGVNVELRLEALERDRLSTELIMFGVIEHPAEDPRAIAADIASSLNVVVSPGDIISCFRISARGDRPRPLVVGLSFKDIRNR